MDEATLQDKLRKIEGCDQALLVRREREMTS